MTNIFFDNNIISFGHATKEEKKSFLNTYSNHNIFMDLTCFDLEEFYGEFPQLKGSFSALFNNENKKIEVHYKTQELKINEKFQELGFTPVETTIVSCGFIYPRTIVQIINEAYYALHEGVATKDDIDRAMKFGVNYPKGPFEWALGKEIIVLTLLKELYFKTGDKRYLPAPNILE